MARFYDLPKEIVFEILTRLPIESVMESKLVCKPWRDLIRHISFSQKHLNHLYSSDDDSGKLSFIFSSHPAGIAELYYAEYDENCHETLFSRHTRMNLTLTHPIHNADYALVGSCNGLICFNASVGLYHDGPACVFNPITREYVILPKCEKMYWWTGFGYLHTTNEYKVVRIYESGGDSNFGIIQVYTLGSGNGWRNAGTMETNMKYVEIGRGAFANEALYWVNYEGFSIHAFHLGDEKCSELPQPPPCLTRDDVPYMSIKLGVLGDLLSAAYYYEDADNCDIWLLKKDADNIDFSWSKEFILVTPPGGVSFELTKNGKLLYYELDDIYCYDPKVPTANVSASFGIYISSAILHKNTLISLKALGEQDMETMEFSSRERSSEVIESSATA